jgi:hypothetical protein
VYVVAFSCIFCLFLPCVPWKKERDGFFFINHLLVQRHKTRFVMWYSKTALCISINLSFRECLTFKWRTWRKVQKVQIPIERGACILHFFFAFSTWYTSNGITSGDGACEENHQLYCSFFVVHHHSITLIHRHMLWKNWTGFIVWWSILLD